MDAEGLVFAEGFVFIIEFNPQEPSYNADRVAEYFEAEGRALEFAAWRRHFFPGQFRCDRCVIRGLDCDFNNNNNNYCDSCALTGSQCTYTNDVPLPDASYVTQQVPGLGLDESLPDPFFPDNNASLVQNPYNSLSFPTIDMDGTFSCPMVPGQNQPPAEPALDPGFPAGNPLQPTTNQLSQLLAPNAQPAASQPNQLIPAPSSIPSQNPQSAVYQPNQFLLPAPTPSLQHLQPAASQPNQPNFDPVITDVVPRTITDPVGRGKPRRLRCNLCRDSAVSSQMWDKCRWVANSATGQHYGCSQCRYYGLVCVVDDIALPPNPDAKKRVPNIVRCWECRRHGTNCERARPCSACMSRGTPFACDAEHKAGTFKRGVGYGTELYAYISTLLGGGPTGVNCHPDERYPNPYDQPPTYHIDYVRWLNGGPIPMPPGYSGPIPDIPRPNLKLRILSLPLPVQRSPNPASLPARTPASLPAPSPAPLLAPILAQPFQPLPAWVTAQAPNLDLAAVPSQVISRPVIIPPDVDQNEIAYLGQGATTIFNLVPDLNLATILNALFVPPVLTLYDTTGSEPVTMAHLTFPPDHPEYADLSLLVIPPPDHPNPAGIPSFLTVLEEAVSDSQLSTVGNCMEQKGPDRCGKVTLAVCEDMAHDKISPFPLCGECINNSKVRFEPALANIARELRAYACGPCAAAAQDPNSFEGKGFRVWGFPQNAFDGHQDIGKSTGMGLPLRLTGCNCATKLLDRRLCTAHRLEHFLDMRAKAQRMRQYVTSLFGRRACPFCLSRVGVDARNFSDEQGIPFPNLMYTCMACFGVVLATPAIHAMVGP
ncbi:hypothetical protein F5Y12DRAFT_15744 [Xylaria sp. FL1777]|nr:hypothetical protein F5Y12DRAFT_15744 [Xylaria sp. FL1777]